MSMPKVSYYHIAVFFQCSLLVSLLYSMCIQDVMHVCCLRPLFIRLSHIIEDDQCQSLDLGGSAFSSIIRYIFRLIVIDNVLGHTPMHMSFNFCHCQELGCSIICNTHSMTKALYY